MSLSKGSFCVCNLFRAKAAWFPTISGRCESVCPTLTATGPREATAAHNLAARSSVDCCSGLSIVFLSFSSSYAFQSR